MKNFIRILALGTATVLPISAFAQTADDKAPPAAKPGDKPADDKAAKPDDKGTGDMSKPSDDKATKSHKGAKGTKGDAKDKSTGMDKDKPADPPAAPAK